MCYDVAFQGHLPSISSSFPDLQFDDEETRGFLPIDHIQGVSVFAPHPILYINRKDLKPHCRLMEWGIIEFFRKEWPHWKSRNGMLNIRSERILADASSYWFKIKNRRCLIPVTGIYEHRGIPGWKKKVPYWIAPVDQPIFYLPGLYSVAEILDKDTGALESVSSFGMITRSANGIMQQIHNSGDNTHRMPLFLPLSLAKSFLSEDLSITAYYEILAYKMPSTQLQYHPVFTIRSSKPRPDDQPKNHYWPWENLPHLIPIPSENL